MMCIVLYLYIYIALLEVHANQKRFHAVRETQREECSANKVNKHKGMIFCVINLCGARYGHEPHDPKTCVC